MNRKIILSVQKDIIKMIQNLTEYSLRINASPMGINYNENFLQWIWFFKRSGVPGTKKFREPKWLDKLYSG